MPDARDRAEAQHHLLVYEQDRDQQRQRPQQRRAVVLAGLGVGAEGAGIVVADHDDEPGTEDRQERLEARPPADPGCVIALGDGAERAANVAAMGLVQDGRGGKAGRVERRGVSGHRCRPTPRIR